MALRLTPCLALCLLWGACAFDRAPAQPLDDVGGAQDAPDAADASPDLDAQADLDASPDLDAPDLTDADDPQDAPSDVFDDAPWSEALCFEHCAHLRDCVDLPCDLELAVEGGATAFLAACVEACGQYANYRQELARYFPHECLWVSDQLCRYERLGEQTGCDCASIPRNSAPVGIACVSPDECPAAQGTPSCLQRAGEVEFVGGYCTVLDCTNNLDCGDHWCLRRPELPQSLCYADCDLYAPEEAPPCREGYGCFSVDDENQRGACLPTCEATGCPEGQLCWRGGCLKAIPCEQDLDCPADQTCLDGVCAPTPG